MRNLIEGIIATMNIQELLNRTDRFAANAGCKITEVDAEHASLPLRWP